MKKFLIIITYLSIVGVLFIALSDLWGAQIFYIVIFGWVLIPLIISYAVTLFIAIVRTIRTGLKSNRIILYPHLIGLVVLSLLLIYNSDFYKSPIVMETVLMDDLSSITILYRENGEFETISSGWIGYEKVWKGNYSIENDTIFFYNPPYDTDFLPDTMLINHTDSVVYFQRDSMGNFIRETAFASYFKIRDTNK